MRFVVPCPYSEDGAVHGVVLDARGLLHFDECPAAVVHEAYLAELSGLPLQGCVGFLRAWRRQFSNSDALRFVSDCATMAEVAVFEARVVIRQKQNDRRALTLDAEKWT